MDITFVAYDTPDSCGGPFAWAPVFARHLLSRGAKVHVLILTIGDCSESAIAEVCRQTGIDCHVLDTRATPTLDEQVEWILRKWVQQPTELFIANLVLPALIAGKWIKYAGGKTIGVIHSNPEHDSFYRDFINTFVKDGSNYQLSACVAVSNYIRKVAYDAGANNLLLKVIPCGAELATCHASFCNEPFRVMFCGRLEQHQKRIRDVVHAMKLLTATLPTIECSIFGAGSEESWVRSEILGNSKIYFGGRLLSGEVRSEMCAHQALLLLSDFEGLPIVLNEAMLSGLVPVCFYEPSGSGEIIENDVNGLLVDNRTNAVVTALRTLLDRDVWERLSRNARRSAESHYSYNIVMEKWWQLLSQLQEGKPLSTCMIPAKVLLKDSITEGSFVNYAECRDAKSPYDKTISPLLRFRKWIAKNFHR